jgi:hypothetical protein
MMPSIDKSPETATLELVERQRKLYEGSEIDVRLEHLIRDTPHPTLSSWDIQRLLHDSRAVYFDSHVEVVSGHHTDVYLRFESIARFPDLVTIIASNMAEWIHADVSTPSADGNYHHLIRRAYFWPNEPATSWPTDAAPRRPDPVQSRDGQDRHRHHPRHSRNGRTLSLLERRDHSRTVRQQIGKGRDGSRRTTGRHDGLCQTRQRAIPLDGRTHGAFSLLLQR